MKGACARAGGQVPGFFKRIYIAPGGGQRWRRKVHPGVSAWVIRLGFGARAFLPAAFFPGAERRAVEWCARMPVLRFGPRWNDQPLRSGILKPRGVGMLAPLKLQLTATPPGRSVARIAGAMAPGRNFSRLSSRIHVSATWGDSLSSLPKSRFFLGHSFL